MFILKNLSNKIIFLFAAFTITSSLSMEIQTYEKELKTSVQYHATNGACLGLSAVALIHFLPGIGGASLFTMILFPTMGGILGGGYGGYRFGSYFVDGLYHEWQGIVKPPQEPTYLQKMGGVFMRVPQLALDGGMSTFVYTKKLFSFFEKQKTQ